jgi:cholesterol transport system auxiliary component
MKKIATNAYSAWARGLFIICILAVSGCTLPRPANTPVVYDFGPGALHTPPTTRIANLPPLELGTPQASMALNSTAVLYRLGYADAQQLKPYTLARWSMPPAQLIGQRLRSQLGLHRAVVLPGEITVARPARANASAPATTAGSIYPPSILNLHLELEEFSQLFEAPDKSSGVLRLRATVTQRSAAGETLLAQRSFIVQQTAATSDASGGVRALTAATDQAIQEMAVWLVQVGLAGKAP